MGKVSSDHGKKAELLARNYLKRTGYEIINVNWRCKHGELDIVAVKEETLVFFEVKYRTDISCGYPIEYIGSKKIACLEKAINKYLSVHNTKFPFYRVDALSLYLHKGRIRLRVDRNVLDFLSGSKKNIPYPD